MTVQRAVSRQAQRLRCSARRAIGRLRRDQSFAPISLPYLVLVAAHHKAGSAWIGSIFREVCIQHGLRFYAGDQSDLPPDADVFFQRHARFDTASLPHPYRGLHFIRDPRDVIISGSFYHETAAEPWLDRPQRALDGISYRQALAHQPTRELKILFEMEHTGSETVNEMLTWDRDDPSFRELKYEALVADRSAEVLLPIFAFLGFPAGSLANMVEIARNSSTSDGRARAGSRGHIRSGIPGEWRTLLTVRLRTRFVELFDDALVTLGYEGDNSWVRGAVS